MPIKAGWRDAFLAFWDFSRSNKHCIQLSTTTSLFSLLQCPHFRSSRPELFYKKDVLKNFAKFVGFSSGTGGSSEFCDILKNTFFCRPPPVTASGICTNKSAAEAWIYLVSFYGGGKDFISTFIFPKIIRPNQNNQVSGLQLY